MSIIGVETGQRLRNYYPFDEAIISQVAEVTFYQSGQSFPAFRHLFGIPSPQFVEIEGAKPISVLDMQPRRLGSEHNPHKARVMHLGMGNGLLDCENQFYQAATVFAADPTVRTIVFGNPGGPGQKEGLLSFKELWQVARGNTRPLIDAKLRYLAKEKITEIEHDGFSFGTLPALTATEHADKYDQEVTHVTTIEPADVKKRGIKPWAMAMLGIDFIKTGVPLPDYIDANNLQAFKKARDDSALRMAAYSLGIFRFNNLVRSSVLANDRYEARAVRALEAQPDARLHAVWGSESELAKDGLMQALTSRLEADFPDRFARTRLPGQKHNMVNDLALQSAIWLHARQN